MVLYQLFYRVAFLVTAFIHLWFNDLVQAFINIVVLCLSSSKQPIIHSILRLHSVVLTCFVLAFCFNAVSAEQAILGAEHDPLNFDDIATPDGFGNVPTPYHGLIFTGFSAFKPSHPSLDDVISTNDLNCAVSKPNALYGTKVSSDPPSIQAHNMSQTFSLHRLKIKPLDLPIGFVTIHLQGFATNETLPPLTWNVDFPAGFHDILDVRVKEFTKKKWEGLTRLEMWAEFHYGRTVMKDWELCVDDIQIELD